MSPCPWRIGAERACTVLCAVALTAASLISGAARSQSLTVSPDRGDGLYQVGDTVHWTVESQGSDELSDVSFVVKEGGRRVVAQGELAFRNQIARLETTFDTPNTVLVDVSWRAGGEVLHAMGGAVAAGEQIRAAAPPPEDFDAFWNAKLVELAHVPMNPQLAAAASGKTGVAYWEVTLDNIRGSHVHGQLARPEQGEKFPALLIVQYAGVYPLEKAWVTDRAAEGWMALDVEAHDLPIDEPAAFYDEQYQGPLKDYWAIGNDDPDASYYLRMYLSCCRAVEYLKSRSDWNGKTLVVMGTSQGGQQALVTAGLHPQDVTAVLAFLPAGCDMLAPEVDRAAGFPDWWSQTAGKDPAKVHHASRYYDPANFAGRIRCPVLSGLGLRDDLAPPSSVLAALNNVTAPKEVIILPTAGHQDENGSQRAYNDRCYGVWLPTLRAGKPAPAVGTGRVNPNANGKMSRQDGADRPVPQSNPLFLAAHEMLLKKKTQGVIDVYFLGDSITRRWQGTDYPEHKKNWDRNFRGWNVADFGWGGDTTQNVLWRLENGELDGVNPKVVVLMIGTNNVGGVVPQHEDAAVKDVAQGIGAILSVVRRKAPTAKIVLMGITPRNDGGSTAVMPTIDKINARLAKLADGETVVYLNVNDRLADVDGKLLDGVTEDGLHLSNKGYQVWADALAPLLTKWLGPPAEVDRAPPASGVPTVPR